jgi:flagellar biogenesis protein FliO
LGVEEVGVEEVGVEEAVVEVGVLARGMGIGLVLVLGLVVFELASELEKSEEEREPKLFINSATLAPTFMSVALLATLKILLTGTYMFPRFILALAEAPRH